MNTTTVRYAGVAFDVEVWIEGGGPGLRPWCESRVAEVRLVDPDEWHEETTSFPFTQEGVRSWLDAGGGADLIHELALDAEGISDRYR